MAKQRRVEEAEAAHRALERQQQAEGLIRFMLGDLRKKLEPIGRLEVLSDVGEQALRYFDTVPQEDLSAAELASYATALHQIGDLAHRQGDLDAALDAFEQALELVQDLAGRRPDDPALQLELAISHKAIGATLRTSRRLEEAAVHHCREVEIKQALLAAEPDNHGMREQLAISHGYLGDALDLAGETSQAIEHLESADRILAELVALDPSNLTLQHFLGNNQSRLGIARERSGDLDAARKLFLRSVEVLTMVVASDPSDTLWQTDLASTYLNLGWSQRRSGQHQAATETAGRVVRLLEDHLQPAPGEPLSEVANRRWAKARGLLGQLAADRGETVEARAFWQQALANIESVDAVSWSLAEVQVHVFDGLGRTDDAEALLEQWHAAGYSLRRFSEM